MDCLRPSLLRAARPPQRAYGFELLLKPHPSSLRRNALASTRGLQPFLHRVRRNIAEPVVLPKVFFSAVCHCPVKYSSRCVPCAVLRKADEECATLLLVVSFPHFLR